MSERRARKSKNMTKVELGLNQTASAPECVGGSGKDEGENLGWAPAGRAGSWLCIVGSIKLSTEADDMLSEGENFSPLKSALKSVVREIDGMVEGWSSNEMLDRRLSVFSPVVTTETVMPPLLFT
jgi:hypothetical protein